MPRDLKTESAADLPELKEWQYKAILDFIKHGNKSRAFRENHPTASGWTQEAIKVEAYRFFQKPHVRLTEVGLREKAIHSTGLQLSEYIQGLLELRHAAEATGNYGAAVQALKAAGQASGHHDGAPEEQRPASSDLAAILDKVRSAQQEADKRASIQGSGTVN